MKLSKFDIEYLKSQIKCNYNSLDFYFYDYHVYCETTSNGYFMFTGIIYNHEDASKLFNLRCPFNICTAKNDFTLMKNNYFDEKTSKTKCTLLHFYNNIHINLNGDEIIAISINGLPYEFAYKIDENLGRHSYIILDKSTNTIYFNYKPGHLSFIGRLLKLVKWLETTTVFHDVKEIKEPEHEVVKCEIAQPINTKEIKEPEQPINTKESKEQSQTMSNKEITNLKKDLETECICINENLDDVITKINLYEKDLSALRKEKEKLTDTYQLHNRALKAISE